MRLLDFWTMGRATRIGLLAGLAALVLWPLHAALQEPVRPAFIVALAMMAVSGLTIMFAVATDIATVRRGRVAMRARLFDLALGLVLSTPPLLALPDLLA